VSHDAPEIIMLICCSYYYQCGNSCVA